ncbi:MAG: flagellar basal body protein [Candidatus Margulisiibacteriota bacterium]
MNLQQLQVVESAIYDAARRQAVYSYNVANASTQGYEAVVFEDELEWAEKQGTGFFQTFNLENEMAKMATNGLRHSTLTKLFSTHIGIIRRVATMGKGS